MDYETSMRSIADEGFHCDRFREYFPFGYLDLREGNYLRLATAVLENLPDAPDQETFLALLDAQAAVFLEQVWVQNEQVQRTGSNAPFKIEGHFASAWLQINDNLRRTYGLPTRSTRAALLELQPTETIADRIVGFINCKQI